MSESNKPRKSQVIVSDPIEDAAQALHISVEEIKKYLSDKPLRRPDPPKPQPGENGPAG